MRRDYVTVPDGDIRRVQESVRISFRDLGDVAWGKVIVATLPAFRTVTVSHGLGYVPRGVFLGPPGTMSDVKEIRTSRTTESIQLYAESWDGSDTVLDVLVF